MISDDDTAERLLELLDTAVTLIDSAVPDAPLHSGMRRQWYEDRNRWRDDVLPLTALLSQSQTKTQEMTNVNADPRETAHLITQKCQMRVGRKLKRTLYLVPPGTEADFGDHLCVGMVDSEILAQMICDLWNQEMAVSD